MADPDLMRKLKKLEVRIGRVEPKPPGGMPSGTAFPTSPPTGVLFFRTDINMLFVYDGSQWITAHEYVCVITYSTDLTATYAATTAAVRRGILRNSHIALLVRGEISTSLAAGTSDATNYWTVAVVAANLGTTLWTFDTKTDSAAATTLHTTTSFTQPASATDLIRIDLTKTAAPPNISIVAAALFYRIILT